MKTDVLCNVSNDEGKVLNFPASGITSFILHYKHIEVNTDGRTVTSWNNVVRLQPLEFDLLVLLIKNMGRALTRDEMLNEVWGYDFGGFTRTVDNHISRLRAKLGLKHHIVTVSKCGYMLIQKS